MAKVPTTRAGKERKIKKVLGEAKAGTLRTFTGAKPVSRKQSLAIALTEAGVKRKPKKMAKKPTKKRKK